MAQLLLRSVFGVTVLVVVVLAAVIVCGCILPLQRLVSLWEAELILLLVLFYRDGPKPQDERPFAIRTLLSLLLSTASGADRIKVGFSATRDHVLVCTGWKRLQVCTAANWTCRMAVLSQRNGSHRSVLYKVSSPDQIYSTLQVENSIVRFELSYHTIISHYIFPY